MMAVIGLSDPDRAGRSSHRQFALNKTRDGLALAHLWDYQADDRAEVAKMKRP
jgi:hypothetical protein